MSQALPVLRGGAQGRRGSLKRWQPSAGRVPPLPLPLQPLRCRREMARALSESAGEGEAAFETWEVPEGGGCGAVGSG